MCIIITSSSGCKIGDAEAMLLGGMLKLNTSLVALNLGGDYYIKQIVYE